MALDNMGRVFLTNDPDISMFRDHMDKNHYYAGDRRTFALATLIVFTFLSTITTILRIYTRTRIIKAFGSDDWVMMIAQLGFFHYLGFQFAEVVYGTGLRRDQLTIENAEMGLKYWYFCAISYSLVTVFVKVTIGLFLLRFTTHKIQNILIWVINIACCIVGLGYFIFLLLTCHPFDFYWNLDPAATGHCFTAQTWLNVGYFVAACNVGADAIFAVIPMFIVWGTTMNSKTKFGVCILLGMGSVYVSISPLTISTNPLTPSQRSCRHNHPHNLRPHLWRIQARIPLRNLPHRHPLYHRTRSRHHSRQRCHFSATVQEMEITSPDHTTKTIRSDKFHQSASEHPLGSALQIRR